jgi:hypothetical protein
LGWVSSDEFSLRYSDLVTGSYDCVDRIVLNAFFPLGYQPGGLRTWWRRLHGDSDAELDNTHLMRMAGRFARRVKAWGAANGVPVIFCRAGERKHRIAEADLATHEVGVGVFLVLVAKAPAPVWKVARSSKTGAIVNIERRREYDNHYSFHIIDPEWGHVTIKMSGHPPFGAQIILNGHEFVARQATAAGIAFDKVGNCFTAVADPAGLARIADALSQHAAVGRLRQVCQRWIYTACLCFGLDLDEQHRSGFGYGLAVYQLEYSRNLIFADGLTRERRAWRQTRLFSGGMPLLEPAAGSTSRWMFPSFELFESMRSCGVLESRTASEMTDLRVLRLGRRVTPPRLVTG